MNNKKTDFEIICEWLKDFADRSHAGKAFVDFTMENGDVFRIVYKPAKKGENNGTI